MDNKHKEIDLHVGQRIKYARKAVKRSATYLSDALGVSYQQVQKYENGKNRVSAGKLFHIATLLDVPVTYFYEGLDQNTLLDTEVVSEKREEEVNKLVSAYSKLEDPKVKKIVLQLIEENS